MIDVFVTDSAISKPITEPVSLADVKAYLGIEADADRDDKILKDAISQCRAAAERYSGRIISDRDFRYTAYFAYTPFVGHFTTLELTGPIIKVNSVKAIIKEKEVDLEYTMRKDHITFNVPECNRVEIIYRAGCMARLGAEVEGAIKEMVRIRYRRDGSELLTEEIKRALGRRENI